MGRCESTGIDDAQPARACYVGADDDVEIAPAMHRQIGLARKLETPGHVTLGTPHALRDGIEFTARISEQCEDLVGFAQISRPQNDRARLVRARRRAQGSSNCAGSSVSSEAVS